MARKSPGNGLQARQLSREVRTRQLITGAAVHDPNRRFATLDYRTAKGLFDHLVGERLHFIGNGEAEGFSSF
jgi:hypothetical protein